MLAEPASEDEYEDCSTSDYATPLDTNAALLGFQCLTHSLQQYHPSLLQSVALLHVFTENVVPLVRILHLPTATRIFWDAIASIDALDKNTKPSYLLSIIRP
jgi:hypothetical protein